MNQPRKSLTDIFHNSDRERLSQLWRTTAAAEERGPLPPGEYTFRVVSGELFTSKSRGTPGYKLALEATEGEYEGRRAWVDFWLTPAALPMTKRDLAKIGVKDLDQLERPLPPGILIRGKLTLRRDDDGNETNRLAHFQCVGVEPGDAFEPKDDADQGGTAASEVVFPFGGAARPADDAAPGEAARPPEGDGAAPAGTNGAAARPKRSRKTPDAAGTEGGPAQ